MILATLSLRPFGFQKPEGFWSKKNNFTSKIMDKPKYNIQHGKAS